MNLGDIRDFVIGQLRKDKTGGYVGPDVFQTVLVRANLEMFNRYSRNYEDDNMNTDALRPFVETLGYDDDNPLLKENGYFNLPSEYAHISSMRVVEYNQSEGGVCQQILERGRDVDVLTDAQFNIRRDSSLTGPTVKRPIGTIQNNKILVLPSNYNAAQITYIRKPLVPFFDWTSPNLLEPDVFYLPPGQLHDGSVLPNGTPSRSVEFEWPDDIHSELADMCTELMKNTLIPAGR